MIFLTARQYARGFTATELAVVIAVTVVLVAVVFSAYITYSARAEVSNGMLASRALQTSITDLFRRSGEIPTTAIGLDTSTRGIGVESMTIEDGRIDIVYGSHAKPAIAGRRLSLTPYETATLEVVWICGNSIPEPGLHPLGFAGGGRQAVQIPTTIEARYLPPECR